MKRIRLPLAHQALSGVELKAWATVAIAPAR